MFLKNLELINFKNITSGSCSFVPKLNCFLGGNGMGKTNLLDAIHYLSVTKSHIGTIDKLAIHHNAQEAILLGNFSDSNDSSIEEKIALRIRRDKGKTLSKNGRVYKRIREHIGRFPIVVISPQDYRLIRGGSEERRSFLDKMLAQQDPLYLSEWIKYEQALVQRNYLLKTEALDPTLYEILEEQMAYSSSFIVQKREDFIASFTPIFSEYYKSISNDSEEVKLEYHTSVDKNPEKNIEELRKRRPLEKGSYTSYGVHKDDLEMLLGDYLIRKIGSEGQNKTYLTALKFADYHMLSEQLNCKPILLLDDLFDRLDADRVQHIIELVASPLFGQIFITDTNRKYLDAIIATQKEEYHMFKLDRGDINLIAN